MPNLLFIGVLNDSVSLPEWISAFSAVASLYVAYQVKNIAKQQLWQSLRTDRQEVYRALISFNGFIQRKICTYKYDANEPGKFLITAEECRLLDDVRELVFRYASSLGSPLGKEIQEWYDFVFSELSGQMRETEHGGGKSTLPEKDQAKYLKIRNKYAEEVHDYLNKIQSLLYFEPQSKPSWIKRKIMSLVTKK